MAPPVQVSSSPGANPGRGVMQQIRAAGLLVAVLLAVVATETWTQETIWSREPSAAISRILVGGGFAVTAVLLRNQVGQRGNSQLFALLALVWVISQTIHRDIGAFAWTALWAQAFVQLLAAAILLRYPNAEYSTSSRIFVTVNAIGSAAFPLALVTTGRPKWAEWAGYSGWWPSIWADRGRFDLVQHLYNAWLAGAAFVFVVLLVRRWTRLIRLEQRTMLPILIAAIIAAAGTASNFFGPMLGPGAQEPLVVARAYSGVTVSLAFVISAIQVRLARAAVTELVARLAGPVTIDQVRDALRRALDDKDLEVLYWLPDDAHFVDSEGLPREPSDDVDRLVIPVSTADEDPLAVVQAAPSLRRHRSLVDAAIGVSRLALENTRLQAGLRSQLAATKDARSRLVKAGLEERRRLERDLHDGAQQRLLGIGLRLGAIRAVTPNPSITDAIEKARAEIRLALQELRDLAHGIYPALLTQAGLGPAVEAVAERLPITVRVRIPERRFGPDLESTAYLVICETLTNVAKHAGPCIAHVTVDVREGWMHVDVSDDGRGFSPEGAATPLSAVQDRLAAAGGTLTVASVPAEGTHIHASLPCDEAVC